MADTKMEYYAMNAKLCRLIQANPCMYDRSSPNYLKKEHVDKVWAYIAIEMNDSVGSCKERWRNIRTAFARSINVYKTPAGPNRHKRYYLHAELQFLTKHIAQGMNSPHETMLMPIEIDGNNDNSHQSADESTIDKDFESVETASSKSNEDVQELFDDEPPTNSPPAKIPKTDMNLERTETVDVKTVPNPNMEFLKGLLPEMDVMNCRQRIIFKSKVYQALQEAFDNSADFPPVVQQHSGVTPHVNQVETNTSKGEQHGHSPKRNAKRTTRQSENPTSSSVEANIKFEPIEDS